MAQNRNRLVILDHFFDFHTDSFSQPLATGNRGSNGVGHCCASRYIESARASSYTLLRRPFGVQTANKRSIGALMLLGQADSPDSSKLAING